MPENVILPGDAITSSETSQLTLGPGIYRDVANKSLIPTNAGLFHTKKSGSKTVYYIDSNSKRYIPQANDYVIGIVSGVVGESYKVQLQNFSSAVLLSFMAFPNASKKNRPNLRNGQAVYARVSQAIPEIDVEIECIDPTTGKDGGFGVLDESGYLFEVNLNYARELLFNHNSPILEKLASKCKFELAVGINGKIWLKCGEGIPAKDISGKEDVEMADADAAAQDLKVTLAASRFIQRCQHIPPSQVDAELKRIFHGL